MSWQQWDGQYSKKWNLWPRTPKKKVQQAQKDSTKSTFPPYESLASSSSRSGSSGSMKPEEEMRKAMQTLVQANGLVVPDEVKQLIEENPLEQVKSAQSFLNKKRRLIAKLERLRNAKASKAQAWQKYRELLAKSLKEEQERYEKDVEDLTKAIETTQMELDRVGEEPEDQMEDQETVEELLQNPETNRLNQARRNVQRNEENASSDVGVPGQDGQCTYAKFRSSKSDCRRSEAGRHRSREKGQASENPKGGRANAQRSRQRSRKKPKKRLTGLITGLVQHGMRTGVRNQEDRHDQGLEGYVRCISLPGTCFRHDGDENHQNSSREPDCEKGQIQFQDGDIRVKRESQWDAIQRKDLLCEKVSHDWLEDYAMHTHSCHGFRYISTSQADFSHECDDPADNHLDENRCTLVFFQQLFVPYVMFCYESILPNCLQRAFETASHSAVGMTTDIMEYMKATGPSLWELYDGTGLHHLIVHDVCRSLTQSICGLYIFCLYPNPFSDFDPRVAEMLIATIISWVLALAIFAMGCALQLCRVKFHQWWNFRVGRCRRCSSQRLIAPRRKLSCKAYF